MQKHQIRRPDLFILFIQRHRMNRIILYYILFIFIMLQNDNNINLDQNNSLQPLHIPDVEHELVPPPCTCTSAKSNTNRFAGSCRRKMKQNKQIGGELRCSAKVSILCSACLTRHDVLGSRNNNTSCYTEVISHRGH